MMDLMCVLSVVQVVALQSHYVKPQPNDLTETILTDDCKEETGLDENAVRSGQPLDFVLEEVSIALFASTLVGRSVRHVALI